ncbi:MAG TPA: sialidase family protein [Pyrinomonadaceae bacterium]|nr:sialidase family protein [Pyrinomonadaceae bacterium]
MCYLTRDPFGRVETRVYYSKDGGNSWDQASLPGARGTHDEQVAFGPSGTAFYLTIGPIRPAEPQQIIAYRSENGGVTWTGPMPLPFMDHPQVIVDHRSARFKGNVYLSGLYHAKEHPKPDYHLGLIRSTDDGRTWTGPVDFANSHTSAHLGLLSKTPIVFTDGEVFIPFHDFPNPLHAKGKEEAQKRGNSANHYWFVTSQDGGETFSTPKRLVVDGGKELAGARGAFYAADNSDGPFRDRVYAVWFDRIYRPRPREARDADGRFETAPARLFITYSADRGKSWAMPQMVSAAPTGDQVFAPSIAVNKAGAVAVSWYDTRDTPKDHESPLLSRYIAVSINGGKSFLPAVRVSSAPTDGEANSKHALYSRAYETNIRFMSGGYIDGTDYLGLVADSEGTFHVLWEDGRTGSSQIWVARVRVEKDIGPKSAMRELIDADVTDRVQAVLDPNFDVSPEGRILLPIRLKNKSDEPIYGPLKVEVVQLYQPVAPSGILNSTNGKTGLGAIYDYTPALGDFEFLPPGGISEGLVWQFSTPALNGGLPQFKLKVSARIERQKDVTPAKSNALRP